ncbi:MAG: hypothetical protein KKC43_00080 [Alphaproteobacteria bacterium]|nr:hypothetical protein [Alphaproteobacteria bacterium]
MTTRAPPPDSPLTIRLPRQGLVPPAPGQAPRPLPTAPLLARLSRLDAVLADPDAHAARLARLIARNRGARAAGRPLGRLTHSAITYVCWCADAAMDGAWQPG